MSERNDRINVSRLDDKDMQGVPAALKRAARRARETARLTGTPLVVRDRASPTSGLAGDDAGERKG